MIRIDLKGEAGKSVVSLDVVRRLVFERDARDSCAHESVLVDPVLATLECRTCHAHLAPTEWIARLAERWQYVQNLTNQYTRAYRLAKAHEARLEERARCTCEHCGRVTRIRLKPLTLAEVSRIDGLRDELTGPRPVEESKP